MVLLVLLPIFRYFSYIRQKFKSEPIASIQLDSCLLFLVLGGASMPMFEGYRITSSVIEAPGADRVRASDMALDES